LEQPEPDTHWDTGSDSSADSGGTGADSANDPGDSEFVSDGRCPEFTADLEVESVSVKIVAGAPALRYSPAPVYAPTFRAGGTPRLLLDDLARGSQSLYLLDGALLATPGSKTFPCSLRR
jgi:hypothetical protein